VFESLKTAIQDLLHGRVAPGDRRAAIASMKRALVSARLGVEDLREGVEQTRRRLTAERQELETVRRRKGLAEGIQDGETATVAEKYERQHAERVAVLEQKLAAQEAEAALAARELGEMMTQLRSASAGVGSAGTGGAGEISDEELGLRDDTRLNAELGGLARERARAEAEAAAEAKLDELKKKMGK